MIKEDAEDYTSEILKLESMAQTLIARIAGEQKAGQVTDELEMLVEALSNLGGARLAFESRY